MKFFTGADGRTYIPYFSSRSVFWNFHPCGELYIDGHQYTSVEQYIAHKKALMAKREDLAGLIKWTHNPAIAKKMARSIKNFDKQRWEDMARKIMKRALLAKFRQNTSFRRLLFKTKDAVLVECSPFDTKWGAGLTEDDSRILDPALWRGENLMGRLLGEVRDELLFEFKDEVEPAPFVLHV